MSLYFYVLVYRSKDLRKEIVRIDEILLSFPYTKTQVPYGPRHFYSRITTFLPTTSLSTEIPK